MLSWLRRALGRGAQIGLLGDGTTADSIERAAKSRGYSLARISNQDSVRLDRQTKAIILASGNEDADLEKARRIAKALPADAAASEAIIAVACSSQRVLTALQDLDSETGAGLRVRPFAPLAQSVRRLLINHRFNKLRDRAGPAEPLIVGTGPTTEQLIVQLFRMMHLPGLSPRIAVVAPNARQWVDGLLRGIPSLPEIGTVSPFPAMPPALSPCAIYVTEKRAWEERLSGEASIPVFWLPGAGEGAPANVTIVPDFPFETAIEEMFYDPVDAQARAIHRLYLAERHEAGDTINARPSMQAWEALPERFRAASRHQADHIEYKLSAISCHTVPMQPGAHFAFTEAELESLAAVEHQRWSAVQLLDGWTHGEVRDDKNKRTPQLAPYEALTQEIKDLDRLSVRAIPAQTNAIERSILRDLNIGLEQPATGDNLVASEERFKRLLIEIASHYPDRFLVVHTFLTTPFQQAAARAALANERTALAIAVDPRASLTKECKAILEQADTIYADLPAGEFPKLQLIVRASGSRAHNYDCPVVEIDDACRPKAAPWL